MKIRADVTLWRKFELESLHGVLSEGLSIAVITL